MFKYIFYRFKRFKNKFRLKAYIYLGAEIKKTTISYGRFTVVNPKFLSIGESCIINEGVHFNCRAPIKIGSNVRISTNVQLHTGRLIIESNPRIHSDAPIKINNNVWIASSVIILAGVIIGENSVIAAGSVVTKDIPANSLAMGTPAKVLKKI